MRFWTLLVGGSSLVLGACSLDWDSLQSSAGDPFDASDELALGDTSIGWPKDSAHPDTNVPDTTDPSDTSADDAAPTDDADDATVQDSSVPDTNVPDTNVADTNVPDTNVPDTNVPDTSVPDAGCGFVFSGTLATYDFSAEPGNQASTAAKSSAAGITAGSISRSGVLVAQSGAGSINSSNWSTGSTIDGTRYYTLTLTPAAKCAMDLSSVSIDTKASGTGPTTGAISTSDDGFVKNTTFATSSVTSVSISVTGNTGAVEIRIYGYNASGSGGTLRIENTMTVTGALK